MCTYNKLYFFHFLIQICICNLPVNDIMLYMKIKFMLTINNQFAVLIVNSTSLICNQFPVCIALVN